ncbi:acetylglutamate kinase [Peijinzhouia sedimentorum]
MQSLKVVKIGGNIIDNSEKLQSFLKDFAAMEGLKILVHGGGKIASELGKRLGIEPKMHNGRRITDEETIELVTMVYAGLVNKGIVSKLQSLNCNALGLTGADANSITAYKRPVTDVDFGLVGDVAIEGVNSKAISNFLEQNYTLVLSPITHDGKGQIFNTNADTIASIVAIAMSKMYSVELMYCFEKKGVLADINDENSLIPLIDSTNYNHLKETGIIADGMIPKLENAFEAIQLGVSSVRILQAEDMLQSDAGTLIQK